MFILQGAEATKNPVLPVVNEIFWGAITFAALYLLVRFVLLPPFKRTMNDRAATIAADQDAADLARQQVASADSEVIDQLAGVRSEADTIIAEAREEAEAERTRLIGRAEREVQAMRELAETELASAREKAMQGMKPQVSELATGAASRVLNRQVSLSEAQPVIDRHLANQN